MFPRCFLGFFLSWLRRPKIILYAKALPHQPLGIQWEAAGQAGGGPRGGPGAQNFDANFYGFWGDLAPGTRGNRFPVSKSIDPPRGGIMGPTPPNHAPTIPKSPSGPTQKLKKIMSGSSSSLESVKNSASNELGLQGF